MDKLFDKTFDLFGKTMDQFGKDVKDAMKRMEKILDGKTTSKKVTTVRIKKGSKVVVNGALVTLVDDVLVQTSDPDTLMGMGKGTAKDAP